MIKKTLFALVLLTLATAASAQQQYKAEAKFVCGRADPQVVDAFAFAPGVYYTSINVTNPSDGTIEGRKRFSVGLIQQKVGPYTDYVGWVLGPGQTMQVDCSDIYRQLGIAPGTFIDGFVHFWGVPFRYNVTGVYTISDGARIVNQDVEEIRLYNQ